MRNYWIRHRLLLTVVLSGAIALIVGLLFVSPYINQRAMNYNNQSIYKNTDIDFIAPDPSFEQISELPGTNGIESVFPYYLTKSQVTVKGSSRTTTVLLSDQFQYLGMTMYNNNRLIKKADVEPENAILVDWQFCHDTEASIGDVVSLSINGKSTEYKIYAIYETNSVYDGGAIIAQITPEQKESIMQNSKNSGYSGMFISADDYNACRAYLTSDYRPLGRLKDRSQFESDEQYQVHYDAIMKTGYSNEITDFRVRESDLSKTDNALMIWIGMVISVAFIFVFNVVMSRRGCEKGYFTKHCIPKGKNVKPYYTLCFLAETLLTIAFYVGVLAWKYVSTDIFIPKAVIDIRIALIPVAIIVAEFVSLLLNNSMLNGIVKDVKLQAKELK